MSAEVDAMIERLWEMGEGAPEGERAYIGGRAIRLARELLGPVYWPITLAALAQIEAEDNAAG